MASQTIQKVALAGASGLLGTPMLHALLNAGFDVTVLTRHSSTATFPSTVSNVVRVDYENLNELRQALKGQDALISTLTTFSISTQEKLIDAAIAAGVKRFLPSEFGSDCSIKEVREMPMYKDKSEIDTYLRSRCEEQGVEMTWTAVYCSCFLDWGIDNNFYLNLKDKTCTLYDGGDFPTATSPTDWVGEAVVGVLKHADETRNREVKVSGIDISQRELLSIAQEVTGKEGWSATESTSQAAYEGAMEVFEKNRSNVWGWVMGMLVKGVFGEGCTRDFVGGKNDNGVLGLRQITREEVRGYFERAVRVGKSSKTF
ncbi:hypothetical protein PRZ48_001929 [Zasmidium cellare]|uniref:NmrA-like domain-containing protein n=1 Tax=Zasmidium cellare TaxID=395010 RepID=A0ABR0F4F2_ZASCE|nr:hypothetical protein PRZ48_001929 [Zasmidium cellare]